MKEESEELNKIFGELEIFEEIKELIKEKFPKDKYKEWSRESFKKLIDLIKYEDENGLINGKEILRKARNNIWKIINPVNRFNNDYDSTFVNSLKNGKWILLDSIENSPPQLLEKINSLNGDEPELDLYETGKDNYFFTKKNSIPNSTLLHEDFFMILCYNISCENNIFFEHTLLNKYNCFCMSPIDSKEIDSAQILYGSLIRTGLEKKICQSISTRFSLVHKFVKDKLSEESSFSKDLMTTGRIFSFIGKIFHKFYENNFSNSQLQLFKPICQSLILYADYYNPIILEKEKIEKADELKQKFFNNLIDIFRNHVPDFSLEEISESEEYLNILSTLKNIQEFAVFGEERNKFDFNYGNFIISSMKIIKLSNLDVIIKHLSDTLELLSKMEIPEKDKIKRLNEKENYYQIYSFNKLLKEVQKKINCVSSEYIEKKLDNEDLLQIEELKIPLSRLHLFVNFVKKSENFCGNVKSCLLENNDLTILVNYIIELYNTKNTIAFKKLLNILNKNPHLFKIMDIIFPYNHFSNTCIYNITYLMNLFTRLFFAKINFKIKVDNDEFLFQFSKNPMKMICYFSINNRFLLDLNSRIERILTKNEKPTILFKIIPILIKDPKKDLIRYNNFMYFSIINLIEEKKEETIVQSEIKKILVEFIKNKTNSVLELDKNQVSFSISRFFNSNYETSLFEKYWGCLLNFSYDFIKYIKTFCDNNIELNLIDLTEILNRKIEPRNLELILNIFGSMKEFCKSNSILWQIITKQFRPEYSNVNLYNNSLKKEKDIINSIFIQEIKFCENIKEDFYKIILEAEKEIDKINLISMKVESEKKKKLKEIKKKKNDRNRSSKI